MPKQRILHLSTLVEKGACTQQVNLFRELFGESVTVTERRAVSVAGRFDLPWAASRLLSQTAWGEYQKTNTTAWYDCQRAIQTAWDRSYKTRQTSLNEYYKARQTALDEYCKILARIFANLYINDTKE
jgi:hypothetical protein